LINAFISIKPKYVGMLLRGEKSIEIRSRAVNLAPGSRLWIYSTLPKGCLEAVANVQSVKIDSPDVIWKHYHKKINISRDAFLSYVNGSQKVSAILLEDVRRVVPSLTLGDLRFEIRCFHPPQFLKHIETASPFFKLLRTKRVKFIYWGHGVRATVSGLEL